MIKFIRILILALTVILANQAVASVLYDNGNLKSYEQLANSGFVDSALALGCIYGEAGSAFGGDQDKAITWYLKNANSGESYSMYQLYLLYSSNSSLKKELYHVDDLDGKTIALKWLHRSANANYALAQYELGRLYDSGDLVGKDKLLAQKWYKRSAENGYLPAREALNNLEK